MRLVLYKLVVDCALGLIQVKKKHALKRVSQRKNPIKPFGVRLGIVWWGVQGSSERSEVSEAKRSATSFRLPVRATPRTDEVVGSIRKGSALLHFLSFATLDESALLVGSTGLEPVTPCL